MAPVALKRRGFLFGAKLPELVKRRSTSREDCRFRSVIAAWTIEDNGSCFIAANLKRAHVLLETGKARGKIVLEGFA